MLPKIVPQVALEFPALGKLVPGATMRDKETVVRVLIQIVNRSYYEGEVVTPALDDLSVENMRDECQEVIIVPSCAEYGHPLVVPLDGLLEEELGLPVVQDVLPQLQILDEIDGLLLLDPI